MERIHSKITVLCGLVAMLATTVFYFLAFDHIFALPMRWLSLLCLLVVELLGTVKAHCVRRSILGTTIAVVSLLHLGAVLVLSLAFVNLFPLLLKRYLLLNLLLLTVVALVDILLIHFDQRAAEANRQYSDSSAAIDECLIKARRLLLETAPGKAYEAQIRGVVESLQYANRSALTGCEIEISTELDELGELLQADEPDAIIKKARDIQNRLALRTAQLKKRGSF